MATKTRRSKTLSNGRYEATFRWGQSGGDDVPAILTKNDHGWFCEEINGQPWEYPSPTNPNSGWGFQVNKSTPLEAVRGFLSQWADNSPEGEEPYVAADRLTIGDPIVPA